MFNTKQNRPAIAHWLGQQETSDYAKAFVASLTVNHPMSKPTNTPTPSHLNRHRVLHGQDFSYGKELYSLQAISLLGFVGWAFGPDGFFSGSGEQEVTEGESPADDC